VKKLQEISLKEKEAKVVGLICKSFRLNYNNRLSKITSDSIVKKLRAKGHDINGASLRNILAYIRRNNLMQPGFILSDNLGYWYSENFEEMRRVWKSQYGRAIEIMTNFKPLHEMFTRNPKQQHLNL
jgi:hypothetical protein